MKKLFSLLCFAGGVTLLSSFYPAPTSKTPSVIHVYVALCDNVNQGIVPVPAKIGNGQDTKNNLYWGCGYGVKMFFKNHAPDWKLLKLQINPKTYVLERAIFRHKTRNCYLIADAYDGKYIKEATIDFLQAAAGAKKESVQVDSSLILNAAGSSQLVCYTGHDGLMDFQLDTYPQKKDTLKRSAIILACYSKSYFKEAVKQGGATPLVWSTGLMSPEAYTLEGAIRAWLEGKNNEEVRHAAAIGYSTYQKTCSLKAARGLLVTGF